MSSEVNAEFHGVGTAEAVEYAEGVLPGAGGCGIGVCVDNIVVVAEVVDVSGENSVNTADFEAVRSVQVELVAPGNSPGIGNGDGFAGGVG